MLKAVLEYQFLQNAVLTAVLASIACGVIGVIIVEKKLVMMSGGIGHTAFGGIGLGYYLKIEPIIGALFVSVLAAFGISTLRRITRTDPDIITGMCWSLGMAAGILFIAFTPGYPPDMTSYLFGDILTVTRLDLKIMLVLDAVILLIIIAYFRHYKAYLFDEEFAAVLGLRTVYLEYLLYVLIALSVVILIRVVGIILIIALLTIPASIARQLSADLKSIMLFSSLLGMIFCLFGLAASYALHIPSGASIILLSIAAYLFVTYLKTTSTAR